MFAAPLAALLALCAAAAARPEINDKYAAFRGYRYGHKDSIHQAINGIAEGCLFGGRWYAVGAGVPARACLRCTCSRGGALTCARRACVPVPDPPPRCHLLHRKGACCPEIHCPEGVTLLEHTATSRADDDGDHTSNHVFPVCVERGVVYAAGSALDGAMACEQCFCLGGARRCVRPRCLPVPAGCSARPAAGACCPARYYCHHDQPTTPAAAPSSGDCLLNGTRVSEGDRATQAESGACERCFCLRGSLHCQPMACAPPLHGCTPLLRPGDCCPHRYQCHNHTQGTRIPLTSNSILAARAEYRSLPVAAKVKRKVDPPPAMSTTIQDLPATAAVITTTEDTKESTTLQPEGTAKIIINGTINCTADLLSDTDNETRIITALSTGAGQPGESFVVNVTSSLHANASASATSGAVGYSVPPPSASATTTGDTNNTAKEDYDYEYAEPTLPPSLPNLKIIPFVAADAVLEETSPPPAPLLEREDTFPVYYREEDNEETDDSNIPVTTSDQPPNTTAANSKAPTANRFSPPIQTEGGFVPKGPGILGEYYAVYPRTPSPAPLLSTSMPLTATGGCVTAAGRRVEAGGTLTLPCQRCQCEWGRLRCVPTACAVPIAPNVTHTPSTTTSTTKVSQPDTTTTLKMTTRTPAVATKSVTEQRTTASPVVTHRTSTPAATPSPTPPALPLPSNDIGEQSNTNSNQHDVITPTESYTTEVTADDHSEDEEEEDEGFSFGSVLKLLLSEYDTSSSTTSTRRPPAPTTSTRHPPAPTTTRRAPVTAPSRPRPPPTLRPVPAIIPPRPLPYTPPIKSFVPNSVNRIDHLVLGEATAIKQHRPSVGTVRPLPPVSTVTSPVTTPPPPRSTTKYSVPPTRSTMRYTVPAATIGPALSDDAANGLPKLAGCNIYGRMYRVDRVIAELSTPCQECRCTVAGVHCRALPC